MSELSATLPVCVDDGWDELVRVARWADDFWLAFVFVDHTASLRTLEERYIQAEGKVVSPTRLATSRASLIVEHLVQQASLGHSVWLDLTEVPANTFGPGWRNQVLSRLNEARGRLLESTRGLVVALPLDTVTSVGAIAPDLWSFRNLVLRIQPDATRLSRTTTAFPSGEVRSMRTPTKVVDDNGAPALLPEPGDLSTLPPASRRLAGYEESSAAAPRAGSPDSLTIALQALRNAQGRLSRIGPREDVLRDIIGALISVGNERTSQGRLLEAIAAYEEAVRQARVLGGTNPSKPDSMDVLAGALFSLGQAQTRHGETVHAEANLRESLSLIATLNSAATASHGMRRLHGWCGIWLAGCLWRAGRLDESRTLAESAVQLARSLWQEEPDDARLRDELVAAEGALALIAARQGHLVVARDAANDALGIAAAPLDLAEGNQSSDPMSAFRQRLLTLRDALNRQLTRDP